MKSTPTSHLPLNAMRAFEAAIRLGSLAAASIELNVTQGAVSRHVKNLEATLELDLVSREGHTIQPTPVGQSLAAEFTNALQTITEAIGAAKRSEGIFRLQVSPSFANRWLIPRIDQMQRAVPNMELALTTTLANNQFDSRSFDAGIIYGDGNWPDLDATLLLDEVLIPVCAPALTNGLPVPKMPSDLDRHMLLHAKIDHSDWSNWLASMGQPDINVETGPAFETMDLAIAAAERGFGITLGNIEFVKTALDANRLVHPFGIEHASGFGYYLVFAKHAEPSEGFSKCISWLKGMSPAFQPEAERRTK